MATASGVLCILFYLASILTVAIMPSRTGVGYATNAFVWSEFANLTGWSSAGLVFLMGMVCPVFSSPALELTGCVRSAQRCLRDRHSRCSLSFVRRDTRSKEKRSKRHLCPVEYGIRHVFHILHRLGKHFFPSHQVQLTLSALRRDIA